MPSGPLLAALAARALDEQEAARPGRHRFRRLAARVGQSRRDRLQRRRWAPARRVSIAPTPRDSGAATSQFEVPPGDLRAAPTDVRDLTVAARAGGDTRLSRPSP